MKTDICCLCGKNVQSGEMENTTRLYNRRTHLEVEHLIVNITSLMWMIRSKKVFVILEHEL